MHADRTNRTALTAFAVLLVAAGVAALMASVGAFGRDFAKKPLFANQVSEYIGRHGSWIWAAAAVLALLVALLALRWIATLLLSTDRAGDIAVAGDRARGVSLVRPGAISTALTAELNTYHGVDSAKARVLGDSTAPRLVVAVVATRNADLTRLRRRIESVALVHARTALDDPALPIQLDLAVTTSTSARVG
ncbi:MAG: alkaline shock response membrane anchor protein AmaP [Actinomycetota bacterium]|nr:alkaline shock response membrane anchor protein AmaP [Actinomycetota bacterium]